jgi:hypothetical protein
VLVGDVAEGDARVEPELVAERVQDALEHGERQRLGAALVRRQGRLASKGPLTCGVAGGRYWDRTSDTPVAVILALTSAYTALTSTFGKQ